MKQTLITLAALAAIVASTPTQASPSIDEPLPHYGAAVRVSSWHMTTPQPKRISAGDQWRLKRKIERLLKQEGSAK